MRRRKGEREEEEMGTARMMRKEKTRPDKPFSHYTWSMEHGTLLRIKLLYGTFCLNAAYFKNARKHVYLCWHLARAKQAIFVLELLPKQAMRKFGNK